MTHVADLTGRRFGFLTALEYSPGRTGNPGKWTCSCSCGGMTFVRTGDLRRGKVNSCGCHARAAVSAAKLRHGESRRSRRTGLGRRSLEYSAWNGMRTRCRSHARYAGRGIRVCARWDSSYEAFLSDMGRKPANQSIDRVNNDGHYSCGKCEECVANGWPANCRWATHAEQSLNKRGLVWIEHEGIRLTVKQWADRLGFSEMVIHARRKKGLSIAEILAPLTRRSPSNSRHARKP